MLPIVRLCYLVVIPAPAFAGINSSRNPSSSGQLGKGRARLLTEWLLEIRLWLVLTHLGNSVMVARVTLDHLV